MHARQVPQFAATLWSEVNTIIGRNVIRPSVIKSAVSLDTINKFFRTIAISGDHQSANSYVIPPSVNCSAADSFRFSCTMSSSVVSLLEPLDTKKSTGPDGLSALFLRKVAAEILEPLTYIYNKSLSTGSFPVAWKQSNVTLVHKGGDADDPGNCRPISVVPIVARVLEKIIASQLSLYLESYHLLNDLQGAYRHGRSADQILLYLVDKIL